MNFMNIDCLLEISRRKIESDRAFILKEEMLKPKSNFGVLLNALGNWMIAKGEGLRKRYSVSEINSIALLQDEARIFRTK